MKKLFVLGWLLCGCTPQQQATIRHVNEVVMEKINRYCDAREKAREALGETEAQAGAAP